MWWLQGGVGRGCKGINSEWRRLNLRWWTRSIVYRRRVVELYNYINQCHANRVNKKEKHWHTYERHQAARRRLCQCLVHSPLPYFKGNHFLQLPLYILSRTIGVCSAQKPERQNVPVKSHPLLSTQVLFPPFTLPISYIPVYTSTYKLKPYDPSLLKCFIAFLRIFLWDQYHFLLLGCPPLPVAFPTSSPIMFHTTPR